jgi:threonine aldolase
MGYVDLRSDTVTRPTAEMRAAMAGAEVGDDAYGEDPTVNALQDEFAARVDKPAALFVPSGVMGNQIALRLLAAPGSLVIAGRRQHVVVYESGAAARNAAVQFLAVEDETGTIDAGAIEWAVAAAANHHPRPSLVCLENTHMPSNGTPWSLASLQNVASVARTAGLAVHLDGARLFNAEVATGTTVAAYAAPATTVMCCLSKGLGAPVGSLLAGPADLIEAARVERHRLGGGMRQAGVIAAAGLVALRTMVDRLAEDHRRAARLAQIVDERWPGIEAAGPVSDRVRTNVVTFPHAEADVLLAHLEREGVLAGTLAPGIVRLVTHLDVDDEGVERACKALASAPT